jgi:hypothetical protein
MNELTVKTNELVLPEIKWNKEEVVEAVNELVEKYNGLEFDESQLDIAKKDLAQIRKVKKNLNSEKIKIKKAWNTNYTSFEDEIKAEMAKIDTLANDIDNQVKTYTDKQKTDRKQAITFYKEWTDIASHIMFDDAWLLKKWESKDDEKLKTLFVELKEEIDRGNKIIKQTATSNNLKPDMYLEKFKSMPLDAVVELIIETAANQTTEEAPQVVEVDTEAQVLSITRTLKGTKSQLQALKDYAEKIGVEWIK